MNPQVINVGAALRLLTSANERYVPVDLQNGVLRLNLPGGTGDVFKYTDDPCSGIDQEQ